MSDKKMKQLVVGIEKTIGGDKKTYWSRVGVAFENKDGSWNLRFDLVPARLGESTIQLRDFDPKEEPR